MRRREFITFLAGAATWPMVARAQQTAPIVGVLNGQSADNYSYLMAALRLGLQDTDFVEGHEERLPAMAVELVNRPVAALVCGGTTWATISAKAATASIPIVFTTGS